MDLNLAAELVWTIAYSWAPYLLATVLTLVLVLVILEVADRARGSEGG